VRLPAFMIARNLGANDTVRFLVRNVGFILGFSGGTCAFCFGILRMFLCSKFTLEDAATVYALICECKYPGIVSEAVVSISRVDNMLR